ncbi:cbb3-type cytochrome c oxidase subunit I [Streptomyces sp. NPDC048521]|uniref:cbb3-type cytochrome c oxidase subunit I n=1 Tax=Streptomyces sp. NPDC048521 TaxID=3365566 RepID=UPI00371BB8FA
MSRSLAATASLAALSRGVPAVLAPKRARQVWSLTLLLVMGVLALLMRGQPAQPEETFLTAPVYDQLFTIHGSGMIYMVMTPFAIGMGVHLVPLQIGAPGIALPRLTLLGHWLYVLGALTMLAGFAAPTGAHADGWFSYPPMADTEHSPGAGTTCGSRASSSRSPGPSSYAPG